jgi:hypothetical protein
MRRGTAMGLSVVVAVVLAAQLLPFGEALEYRRVVAFEEPWRLLTSHFVHLTLLHAILNAVALLLLGRLFEDRLRPPEFFGILFAAPVAISLGFRYLLPELAWYRGLLRGLRRLGRHVGRPDAVDRRRRARRRDAESADRAALGCELPGPRGPEDRGGPAGAPDRGRRGSSNRTRPAASQAALCIAR